MKFLTEDHAFSIKSPVCSRFLQKQSKTDHLKTDHLTTDQFLNLIKKKEKMSSKLLVIALLLQTAAMMVNGTEVAPRY
ncbi:hypothetical protein HOLleu_25207 [Holothuria leucospilota]|uniref:Uncharacterized protein n=1 Tax=Holothuria leucospilota TaxID=206669 RepID=A0A9Q1BSQ3_HOLLE|nr:hypothetical protein HOLleu_25207 [Holothuria leucospilota]